MPGRKVRQAGDDNIATAQVTLATGAAQAIVAARQGRRAVVIVNHSALPAYLGTATITKSTGLYLHSVAGTSVTIPTNAAVYGTVSDVAGAVVSYMEVF